MPDQPKPKNVADYQHSEKFSGRPEVGNPDDRAEHRDSADAEQFAEATAHENERYLARGPEKKPPQSVKPEAEVTDSTTRKSDEDVGGF